MITCAYHATLIPPLLDVPVYSLSTLGESDYDSSSSTSSSTGTSRNQGAKCTMNILTYASPVSSAPHRMWCISLYKGTLSHENFLRERRGVLQLLGPKHTRSRKKGGGGDLIRLLGGSSGRDVNKSELCANLGYKWESLPRDDEENEKKDAAWPQVLPSCLYYLKLELEGDLIDCGSHEVALCTVLTMLSGGDATDVVELDFLSTRKLRRESIISDLGRVI